MARARIDILRYFVRQSRHATSESRRVLMRIIRPVTAAIAIALIAALSSAKIGAEEAGPKPQAYKPVAIELPQPVKDPSFAAFRAQLADIAKRKDRAALAKHVAANFYWMTDEGK